MPRLTIVIPAVDGIPSLESTLVSVLENRPDACEVIVVLNQAYDDPYELKDEVRFVRADAGAGLAACAAMGVAHSRAPVVHLLASGCEVSDGWAAAALEHFDDPQVGAVAPLVIDKQDRRTVHAAGVRYGAGGVRRLAKPKLAAVEKRGAARILGPSYRAAFYRKTLVELSGVGLNAGVGDLLADVDLALALRHAGFRALVEPRSKVYGSAEPQPERTFRQAIYAERLFWRSAPVVGWLAAMVCHPWVVAAEFVANFPSLAMVTQLAGRAVACFDTARHRRHHALLNQISDSAQRAPLAGHLRWDRSHSVRKPSDSLDARLKAG